MTYTLYTSGEYVVLANDEAYCRILKVTGVDECFQDSGTGTVLKREFRYSIDKTTFSEFQEINKNNLESLGSFDQVWFQFRYILLSGGPVTIVKVRPVYTQNTVDPYIGYVAPNIENDSIVYAFPVTYKSNFLWEPYKMNRAIRLYKDLNLMVNNLFGHEIQYYRVLPHGRSKDVFLMEHSLFEHDKMVCLKVVVPENSFPDNKLNMGPFGVDFEMPFEIQIDREYFQKAFGDGTGPQKRDVIYFPRTDRIYEVASSYLFRDFMNEPLYFKITLIKWLPKSNVTQTEEVDNLQSFTVSAEKLFGQEIVDEEVKVTNPQQFYVATTKEDPVRSHILMDQEIKEERIINYHTVISEFNYNMASLIDTSQLVVDISTERLTKDATYYARFSPTSTQPDIQWYFSMKKMTYKGPDSYGKAIFLYSGGNSQVESNFNASQIFGPGSLFSLYATEYDGSVDTSIMSCDTITFANFYYPKIVQYKGSSLFPDFEDRSFSSWFRIRDSRFPKNTFVINNFDIYTREMDLTLAKNCLFFVGDYVEISRVSASEFILYGTVVQVVAQDRIKIDISQYVLNYVQSSFSSWTSYNDLQVQKNSPKTFISSIDNGKGIEIALFGQRHFKVTSNMTEYNFSIPNTSASLTRGSWYAISVNFSNIFKQLTLNVWQIQWNSITNLPATTELRLVFNRTTPILKEDRSSTINYFLKPTSMDLTNIRLFNRVIETDKQVLVLNQNIVKDAQLAIIIDNALPQSRHPYIGYTR